MHRQLVTLPGVGEGCEQGRPALSEQSLLAGPAASCHITAWLVLHIPSVLCDTSHLQGKTKRVWDIKHSTLTEPQPVQTPLESDARHRKDVVFLKQVGSVGAQQDSCSRVVPCCGFT
jgi:hypothetical protein